MFHLVTWCYKFWEKVRGGGTKSVNKTKQNLNNVIERRLQNLLHYSQHNLQLLQNTELRHQNILIRLFASHHISKQKTASLSQLEPQCLFKDTLTVAVGGQGVISPSSPIQTLHLVSLLCLFKQTPHSQRAQNTPPISFPPQDAKHKHY